MSGRFALMQQQLRGRWRSAAVGLSLLSANAYAQTAPAPAAPEPPPPLLTAPVAVPAPAAPAPAPQPASPPAVAPAPPAPVNPAVQPGKGAPASLDADKFDFKLTGLFTVWGLNQRNFFLGDVANALNDADYVVQNFRFGLTAGTKWVGGVLRLDAAQGWWGTDNSPDYTKKLVKQADGSYLLEDEVNPYAMFRDKDTNYPVHFDHAYLYAQLPDFPLRLEAGRQYFTVGNLLVLDNDYDAVRLRGVKLAGMLDVQAWWAKVAEGSGAMVTPSGKVMNDDKAWQDANLFGLDLEATLGDHKVEAFGLYYDDAAARPASYSSGAYKPTKAHLPQGINYLHARFQPQVTSALAMGLRAQGKLAVGNGLFYNAEFDFLQGKDEIANDTFDSNRIDKNNGELLGYNAYLNLLQKLDVGLPLEVGLMAGQGSGDADPSGGRGNVNRIQTMGFFHMTNVWEDSIMPDIAGITPQGLGSPVSRGYRELENTTVVQLRVGALPHKKLRLDASYTYLQATEAVRGWNANGPTDVKASDLGQEVDIDATWSPLPGLSYKVLVGYFMTGKATALLINGKDALAEPSYEVKQELTYRF